MAIGQFGFGIDFASENSDLGAACIIDLNAELGAQIDETGVGREDGELPRFFGFGPGGQFALAKKAGVGRSHGIGCRPFQQHHCPVGICDLSDSFFELQLLVRL